MNTQRRKNVLSRSSQQMAAADPAHSAWVAANAGTGKTHVLIDRITRLMLAGTPPGRILCLTFTKAAAAEMANRLHQRLGQWAVMDDDDLDEELLALLAHKPEAADFAAARRLFAETLDAPEGLKIRTIHSFCESLLARFPLEAEVPPHFSVIDDRSAAELLIEARDYLFSQAFAKPDGPLAQALEHLAELVNENDFAGLMRELAGNRSKLHALLQNFGSTEGVVMHIRRTLGIPETERLADVIPAACRDNTFDHAGLREAFEALSQGTGKLDQARAAVLDTWLAAPQDRAAMFAGTYVPQFLTQKMEPTAASRLISKKILKTKPHVLGVLQNEQNRVLAVINRLRAHQTIEATQSLLTLGHVLTESFERLKRKRDLLDYDDLILTARRLLNTEQSISWVHFKLDGGIDHILIDEAQDTSPEQWDIVASLASDFFTGSGARDVTRTMFAVGDEKQSIFSFQGADPEAFDTMRQYFATQCEQIGQRLDPVELALSFRSVADILQTVDYVFDNAAAREGLTARDRAIRHQVSRMGETGLVELWPTEKPDDAPESDPWDAPLDHLPVTSPPSKLAKRIADQIKTWLEEKTILESQGRPIKPDDIMILVRRRRQFTEEMVRCLKERGIPVAGTDRMILTEQLAVMDLMALGGFVLLPEDDLTLATVLKSPLVGLDEEQIYTLAHGRTGTLWAALQQNQASQSAFQAAHDMLNDLLNKADFMPPFEFFGHVLDGLEGRKKALARLGPDAADPLDEFMSLALTYERDHVASLQGFLHWLETGRTEVKRDLEQGHGEVRVMTVHGAKGLQARVVFLPDTCAAPDARQDSKLLWQDSDDQNDTSLLLWPPFRDTEENVARSLRDAARLKREQEYRRLLYVAMTRAEDRLYIGGWEGTRKRNPSCWYDLIAPVIKEKGEEITLVDGTTGWRISSKETDAPPQSIEKQTEIKTGSLPAWAMTAPTPEAEPVQPLAPSKPTDDEPAVRSPLGEDDGARFKRGRLIYTLLQTLPGLAPDQREVTAQTFLAEDRHTLSRDEQSDITQETLRIIVHPDFAFLFSPGSLAEVPLVAEIDGTVISGQVDRLIVTEQTVAIVDYKTNRPPPQDANDIAPVYLKQMAAYQAALARIYPGKDIKGYLLWTDGPTLMPLDTDRLTPYAP